MPSFLVVSAICITKWQHVTKKKKVYHVALDNWNFLQHKGLYIWQEKVNVEGCHWSPMQVRPRKRRLNPNPQRTSSIACSSPLQEFFSPCQHSQNTSAFWARGISSLLIMVLWYLYSGISKQLQWNLVGDRRILRSLVSQGTLLWTTAKAHLHQMHIYLVEEYIYC